MFSDGKIEFKVIRSLHGHRDAFQLIQEGLANPPNNVDASRAVNWNNGLVILGRREFSQYLWYPVSEVSLQDNISLQAGIKREKKPGLKLNISFGHYMTLHFVYIGYQV